MLTNLLNKIKLKKNTRKPATDVANTEASNSSNILAIKEHSKLNFKLRPSPRIFHGKSFAVAIKPRKT